MKHLKGKTITMVLAQLAEEKVYNLEFWQKCQMYFLCFEPFKFVTRSCGHSSANNDDILWNNLKVTYDIFWICPKKDHLDK